MSNCNQEVDSSLPPDGKSLENCSKLNQTNSWGTWKAFNIWESRCIQRTWAAYPIADSDDNKQNEPWSNP